MSRSISLFIILISFKHRWAFELRIVAHRSHSLSGIIVRRNHFLNKHLFENLNKSCFESVILRSWPFWWNTEKILPKRRRWVFSRSTRATWLGEFSFFRAVSQVHRIHWLSNSDEISFGEFYVNDCETIWIYIRRV